MITKNRCATSAFALKSATPNEVDHYVFEELELLYRATGDEALAGKYGALAKAPAQ